MTTVAQPSLIDLLSDKSILVIGKTKEEQFSTLNILIETLSERKRIAVARTADSDIQLNGKLMATLNIAEDMDIEKVMNTLIRFCPEIIVLSDYPKVSHLLQLPLIGHSLIASITAETIEEGIEKIVISIHEEKPYLSINEINRLFSGVFDVILQKNVPNEGDIRFSQYVREGEEYKVLDLL